MTHWQRLLLAATAMSSFTATGARSQNSGDEDIRDDLAPDISAVLEVDVWSLQALDFDIPQDGGFDVEVRIGNQPFQLSYHPYTMRSPDFRVVDGDGNELPAPPPATYKGDVFDGETREPIGTCIASSWDGQLRGKVRFQGHGDTWSIQHLSDVDPVYVGPLHVVYHDLDTRSHDGTCGVDHASKWSPHGDDLGRGDPSEVGDQICEIALDCDNFYYNWAGGTRIKCIRNAEDVMLAVEDRYESATNAVDITYEITYMVVRKNPGPYTSNNPGILLDQFRANWNANFQDARRDVAHLLTGRNLDGSVIGVAWLSVICDSLTNGFGYGLSQTSFSSNINSRAGLTAHELGHNWSAGHCDGDGDCYIMCSGLGGCSGNLSLFGNRSQNAIRGHRDSRTCLTVEGGPGILPFFDDYESGSHDVDKYSWWRGTRVGTGARNEVSGIRSLRLNATGSGARLQDEIRTHELDTSGDSTGSICLWVEVRGPESGEKLFVEYYTQGKRWKRIGTITSSGVKENVFTQHCYPLTRSNAYHSDFRVRLLTSADETNDNFWVDDLSITTSANLAEDDGGDGPVDPGGPGGAGKDGGGGAGGPGGAGKGGGGGPGAEGDHDGPRDSRKLKIMGAPAHRQVLLYASVEGIVQRPHDPRSGRLELLGTPVLIGTATTDHNGYASVDVDLPRTRSLVGSVAVQGLILGDDVETTTALQLR